MRSAIVVLLACGLSACASQTQRDLAGFGGIEAKTDSFTGTSTIESGYGHLFCPSSEGLLCVTGLSMSFAWRQSLPETVFVTVRRAGYENLKDLQLNVDGQLVVWKALDPMTEFSSVRSGSSESYQRYEVQLDDLRSLMAAQKVLMRVEYLNNRVSETVDFMRPGSVGQPTARDMLAGFLERITAP